MSPFTYMLIRLSKLPALTVSAIRGRVRGAGSEFVLATDIRFASLERAVLGQFEITGGGHPGRWRRRAAAAPGGAGAGAGTRHPARPVLRRAGHSRGAGVGEAGV
ncbi:enoyl-CoA hydratase-related protein [Streptomyces sp. NPDC088261]|uniref:enoyl-CoA hydratase-related protein n=1 Tax=Streptomyces sp. NPDC088261 TaxID=3365851 RepID=UPI00382C038B